MEDRKEIEGCLDKRYHCRFVHFYYRASPAFQEYKVLLTDAREGTPLNKEEFYRTDRIISSESFFTRSSVFRALFPLVFPY
jgi:hypothetical protein